MAGLFAAACAPAAWAVAPFTRGFIEMGSENGAARDNFSTIYSSVALREEFKKFLINVYHLYSEEDFHGLIYDAYVVGKTDQGAYHEILNRIFTIKPYFSELTYALPALAKQKKEIASQAASLLGPSPVNGYIEIGTPGRYVHELEHLVDLKGPVTVVHDHEPGLLSLLDIAERGSFERVGAYHPLGNYDAWSADQIPDASVDVITNFIGIHHAPRDNLEGFVRSIHRALRPGGRFILRDHDAHSREMNAMVGLAHDVYNAGLALSWEKNERELRYFKPLREIKAYLSANGFKPSGEPIFQTGDPTKNALMLFVKKS